MTPIVDSSAARFVKHVAAVVVVSGLFGAALERALLPLINHALRGVDQERVVVAGDVDLAPWRLALVLHDVEVRDRRGVLLAVLPTVDASLDPAALVQRQLRGRLALHAPRALVVVNDADASAAVVSWLSRLPLRWHSVAIDDGSGPVDTGDVVIDAVHVNVAVDNLDNGDGVAGARFARVAARAFVDGNDMHAEGRFDPRAAAPSFALRAVVADVVASVEAKDGRYTGFVNAGQKGDAAFVAAVAGRAAALFNAGTPRS